MKDISGPIRKKYFELLNGNIIINDLPAPVYSDYVANNSNLDCYITIQVISNTEIKTKTSAFSSVTVQFSIYTKDALANAGKNRDSIASQLYALIYPTPNSKIDLEPDFQVVFMSLANDTNQTALQTDTGVYLNRFISFSHRIYHRA